MRPRNARLFHVALCAFFLLATFAGQSLAQGFRVPIAGNTPQVVLQLTNERNSDDTIFTATPSALPGGTSLPVDGNTHYELATYDTGSIAHIISNDAFNNFDLRGADRDGGFTTPITGAGGGATELLNNDPLGVYIGGMQNLNSTDPLAISPIDMRGQFNVSIMSALPGDLLPNIIGTPISSQYTTRINYSEPQIMDVKGTTIRTPALELETLDPLDPPPRRLGLTLYTGGLGPEPAFFPSVTNFDDFGDDPLIPTTSSIFFMSSDVTNNGVSQTGLDFLFDTGAQATLVSDQVAATLGFDVSNDAPDFVVRVGGIGGTVEEVPGFIADEFHIPGTGGGLTLQDVPLVVLNVTDPRDGVNTLPGLIGMNLFMDRDLTLNPAPGNPYVGVSDPVIETHNWASQDPTAQWLASDSWDAPGIPAVDWIANVVNLTENQEANVSGDSTVHALYVTGNDGTMSVTIDPNVHLEVFSTVMIDSGSKIELNDASLAATAIELRGGELGGTGPVGGEVISQGILSPGLPTGVLNFTGSFDQLDAGTMIFNIGGSDDYSVVDIDFLASIAGTVEINTLETYTGPGDAIVDEFTFLTAGFGLTGQFDHVVYNGNEVARQYDVTGSSYRGYAGEGIFLTINYTPFEFLVTAYQAIPGDADGNGEFDSGDLVTVFQAGEYEDGIAMNSDWTEGDWNHDSEFDTGDLVAAFQAGYFETGSVLPVNVVPEPSCALLMLVGLIGLMRIRRRN